LTTWFLIDLVSSIPMNLIEYLIDGHLANIGVVKILKIYRIYKLIKIFSFSKFMKIMYKEPWFRKFHSMLALESWAQEII